MNSPHGMTFTREQIVERLRARPFRPFKVRLQNGRVFNVRESDDLWVGLSGWLVFDSGRNDLGFADVKAVVAIEKQRTRKAAR